MLFDTVAELLVRAGINKIGSTPKVVDKYLL